METVLKAIADWIKGILTAGIIKLRKRHSIYGLARRN